MVKPGQSLLKGMKHISVDVLLLLYIITGIA